MTDVGNFSGPGLQVLLSLIEGPRHGYGIADDIEARTGQRPGPGTLYGAISRLEDKGLIVAVPESTRRRPYRISEEGLVAAREQLDDLEALVNVGRRRLRAAWA